MLSANLKIPLQYNICRSNPYTQGVRISLLPIGTNKVRMADYQIPVRSGQLFYYPSTYFSTPDNPRPYFRPRRARIINIRIVSASPEPVYLAPAIRNIPCRYSGIIKLANPKENAKRLFRFITSTSAGSENNSATAVLSSTSQQSPDTIGSGSVAEGMFAWEGARNEHGRSSSVVGGPVSGMVHRPSLVDNVRTASTESGHTLGSQASTTCSSIGDEKPIASGNGVSISISLAEPVLFLQGFDQHDDTNRTTTMLRGSLHLRILKSAKIKAVTLKFRGRAETEWPEGASEQLAGFIKQLHNCLTNARYTTQENRIQRRGKYHESYMAIFQCSISNCRIWARCRQRSASQGLYYDDKGGSNAWRHFFVV